MPRRQMDERETWASEVIYGAIQAASNNTARTKQQYEEFRLGVSNLGHCRQYAKLLIEQTPFSDQRDSTAAFYGTVIGDAIETRMAIDHPEWLYQHETTFHIPGGGEINGHPDIVIPATAATEEQPQSVLDLKSKAELETVRRYGQSLQQHYQLHCYAAGLIAEGILDGSRPIWLADVFFDRSAKMGITGHVEKPYVIGEWYDPEVINQIDEWINDVKYAVIHHEDASRDLPREFCWSFCEYATTCRGNDTDVEGLIEDQEVIAAVEAYTEGGAMITDGKRMQNSAKIALNRLDRGGSTGTHTVRWVEVSGSQGRYVEPTQPYRKLDIRRVRAPRGKS